MIVASVFVFLLLGFLRSFLTLANICLHFFFSSPQENDPSESDTHTEVNNVTQHSAESPAAFKAPEPLAIKAVETTSILSKRVDDSYDLTKPEDVSEAEGKKPDEPVELDESEASVASSLEPDSERQAEVDETVEKKPRRNRVTSLIIASHRKMYPYLCFLFYIFFFPLPSSCN